MNSPADSNSAILEMSNVTIGIVTALDVEYQACCGVFDPTKTGREVTVRANSGTVTCWLCRVSARNAGSHVVAITLLADVGNNASAIGATLLLAHCQHIGALIMCGIAGAIPNPEKAEDHVRLGDLVVSNLRGVFQYDRGKQKDITAIRPTIVARNEVGTWHWLVRLKNFLLRGLGFRVDLAHNGRQEALPESSARPNFEYRSPPRPPSPELLSAVQRIHAAEKVMGDAEPRRWEVLVANFVAQVGNPEAWKRPTEMSDQLIDTPDGTGDPTPHPPDSQRRSGCPRVFHGSIGSANIVLADPRIRNELRDKFSMRAVEMEGSGIADVSWTSNVGYLVIRGTQDYCSSAKSKNEVWRCYAALVAAAYARTVVEYLHSYTSVDKSLSSLDSQIVQLLALPTQIGAAFNQADSASTKSTSPMLELGSSEVFDKVLSTTPSSLDSPTQVPSVEAARHAEAEVGAYRLLRINDLTQAIHKMMREGRLQEVDVYCQNLEAELARTPRRSATVRNALIQLAQVALQKAFVESDAGKQPDLTKVQKLRKEAENVIDSNI